MQSFLKRIAPVWTPHAGQERFLVREEPIKVLACGRRWGKTDACAIDAVGSFLRDSPTRHVAIAPTLDQATLLFDRVVELLTQIGELPGIELPKLSVRRTPYPKLEIGRHQFVARSGHVGRSLRGHLATHLIVDEAAFVPEAVITEAAMPMLAASEGRCTMLSTPNGTNHFWRFFRMGQEGRHGVWSARAPSSESPRVSEAFLALQRDMISERAYRVEYEAEFIETAGSVFATAAVERCLTVDLEPWEGHPVAIGVDWARYGDYTAVAVLAGRRDGAQLVELAHFNGLAWSLQVERVAEVLRRYPGAVVWCDATGVGDPLLELLRDRVPGLAIEGLTFTQASKSELIDNLAWMLDSGALQFRPEPELQRELAHFEVTEMRGGGASLGAKGGYHDDLVIALALAARGLKRGRLVKIAVGGERQFHQSSRRRRRMGVRFRGKA